MRLKRHGGGSFSPQVHSPALAQPRMGLRSAAACTWLLTAHVDTTMGQTAGRLSLGRCLGGHGMAFVPGAAAHRVTRHDIALRVASSPGPAGVGRQASDCGFMQVFPRSGRCMQRFMHMTVRLPVGAWTCTASHALAQPAFASICQHLHSLRLPASTWAWRCVCQQWHSLRMDSRGARFCAAPHGVTQFMWA